MAPQYTKPSDRVWQEQQDKNGNESKKVLSTYEDNEPKPDGKERELTVEGNQTEAYVGVDPIYQTYANDTEAPLAAEKGVEAKLEERIPEQNNVPSKEAPEASEPTEKPTENQGSGSGSGGSTSTDSSSSGSGSGQTLQTGVTTPPANK